MTVSLTVRVNGGAPQTGAIVVLPGDSVQFGAVAPGALSFDVRIRAGQAPDSWPVPAGWTLAGNGDIFWAGSDITLSPAITWPAIAYWGDVFPILTVNGSADLVDATMIIQMFSTIGLRDMGWQKYKQNSFKSWTEDQQKNLRVYDALFAAASVAGGVWTTTAIALIVAAGTNVQNTSSINDATHSGNAFFTASLATLVAGNTVDLTASYCFKNTGATGGTNGHSYRLDWRALWRKTGGGAPVSLWDSGILSAGGDADENAATAAYAASGTTLVLFQSAGVTGHTLAVATQSNVQLRA
jgi:hypothetical protein